MKRCAIALLAAVFGYGQQASEPRFEVSSVKPAAAPTVGQGTEVHGGPGTNDPGQITYTRMFLSQVFRIAWGMTWDFQLSGPGWIDSERYTINAKIPLGTTQEQFRLMLQNLLVEQFGLKFHREEKIVPAFDLVIANGGPKLRDAEPKPNAAPATSATPRTPVLDEDGFPVLPPGVAAQSGSLKNKRNHFTARMMPISALAGRLERETGRPIVDKTGLTGRYDIKLDYSIEGLGGQFYVSRTQQGLDADTPDDGGPSLSNALQQQLGLKLEDRKEPFDVIVIDHLEKVPVEN